MSVKLFKATRNWSAWRPVIGELNDRGLEVFSVIQPADVSIALSGKFEDPLALHGKRVLFMYSMEWNTHPGQGEWFKELLGHYYHEVHDLAGCLPMQAADAIEEYVTKCSKTANS